MRIRNITRIATLWAAGMASSAVAIEGKVEAQWEVNRIWAVHPSSPPILVTSGGSQYLAYYNADRRLALAWRKQADLDGLRDFPIRNVG